MRIYIEEVVLCVELVVHWSLGVKWGVDVNWWWWIGVGVAANRRGGGAG